MKTSILIGQIATILRAIGRAVLVIAWVMAQGKAPIHEVAQLPQRTALAVPAEVPAAAASAVPEPTALEQTVPERRPSKCGDLPRAPWNTCVALHDHEI
jgi:hypothetical protein